MSSVESKATICECSKDLILEVDALAKANYLNRTDMLIIAVDKLLRFMEGNTIGKFCDSEMDDILDDIDSMDEEEAAPIEPDTQMVEPLAEGEEAGILLLEKRKRKKKA